MSTVIDGITPGMQSLIWLNRDTQQQVFANKTYASNGTLLLNQSPLISGKQIVLGTSDSSISRTDFESLRGHSHNTLTSFTLEYEGHEAQVVWDHTDGPAVTGQDLFEEVGGYDLVTQVSLKFLTV